MRQKLDVGDYMADSNPWISIDRKQTLTEVCSNLCQDRKRFTAECARARAAGIKLVVLVEHGGMINSLEDVAKWKNPRLRESPYAVSGLRLQYRMVEMAAKYGIEWQFCQKCWTGKKIIEILSRG